LAFLSSGARASRGFTLIELGVVVGILALVALVVVPSIEAAFGVRTREEAARLAGAIRAMYGESVLSGNTCRLVFDLDEGVYWPECARGRVAVVGAEESVRGARVEEGKDFFVGTEEQEQARRQVMERSAFAGFTSGLAPRRQLPEPVILDAVWSQHQPEPYTAGTAFLYFFPNGQTERAYIYVGDETDTYTIVVNPMTGRTRVLPERVEIPREELRR